MVISLPSSERIYARSCPVCTKIRPMQSSDPLCTTVPAGKVVCITVLSSKDCCWGVSLLKMGKYSANSMANPPFGLSLIHI